MNEAGTPAQKSRQEVGDWEAFDFIIGRPDETCSTHAQLTKLRELECLNPGGA